MTSKQNSKEYDAALEASRIATRKYNVAVKDYREGKITDEEYLTARKDYYLAQSIFDDALLIELGVSPPSLDNTYSRW